MRRTYATQNGTSRSRTTSSSPSSAHGLLRLQRDAGNEATTALVQAALAAGQSRAPRHKEAIAGVQAILKAPDSGVWDQASVERLRAYQDDQSLPITGQFDDKTTMSMVTDLEVKHRQDAAIWLVIDVYGMDTTGASSITYNDKEVTDDNAGTLPEHPKEKIRGPSEVTIGPNAFSSSAQLIHTVAHELEHVRQNRTAVPAKVGDLQAVEEFEGEAIEILSKGMPAETDRGFFDDAATAYKWWLRMTASDRKRLADKIAAVREKVLERVAAGVTPDVADIAERVGNGWRAVKP